MCAQPMQKHLGGKQGRACSTFFTFMCWGSKRQTQKLHNQQHQYFDYLHVLGVGLVCSNEYASLTFIEVDYLHHLGVRLLY